MLLEKKFNNFVLKLDENFILHVQLSRPKKMNSMTNDFFEECAYIFKEINNLNDVRVVMLTSQGKNFTAGLDLNEAMAMFQSKDMDQTDNARESIVMYNLILKWQQSFTNIQNCRVPVIAGIQGACIGGGIDLITSCDFRLCTENSKFSIKEIDIGLCADIGTFPRINMIVGNDGWVRELAYSGRTFNSIEAKQQGLIQNIYKDQDELMLNLVKQAQIIAQKSPVAIYAIKKVLNQQNKYKIDQLLDYVATVNMSLLKTNDIMESVQATLSKSKTRYAKL